MLNYNENVMDHFKNPRNVGVVESPDAQGRTMNPACGDMIHLTIKIVEGIITDARFKAFGCGAAIASSSKYTEMITGRKVEEALAISAHDIADALGGLPEEKIGCSVLAPEALRKALGETE